MFRPLEETPCHFVSTLDELVELNEKLVNCKEFAVDLEVSFKLFKLALKKACPTTLLVVSPFQFIALYNIYSFHQLLLSLSQPY